MPLIRCHYRIVLTATEEPTTMTESFLEPESAETLSSKQRAFMRYFTAILIDLVVLNLFVEYWRHVEIDSFTISLLAAVLLQVLLKVTLVIEHRIGEFFKGRPGAMAKFLRIFCAWLVLFGSKFVILAAINLAFGDDVTFGGPFHGVAAFIVVVVVMLVAEEAIVRFYRRLG
jgi:hypothetical protein